MPGWFDTTGQELGIDPRVFAGTMPQQPAGGRGLGQLGQPQPDGSVLNSVGGAPQASNGFLAQPQGAPQGAPANADGGQNHQNQWIDFTNQLSGVQGFDAAAGRSGASAAAGSARGNLGPLVEQYNQRYGANARVVNGDRVDFGDGGDGVDVIRDSGNGTSGFWWGGGGGGGQPQRADSSGGGGGTYALNNVGGGGMSYGGGGGNEGGGWAGGPPPDMPEAPKVNDLATPAPFTHPGLGDLSRFQSNAGNVPQPGQLGYTPVQTPGSQTAQQATYNPMQGPQGFQGNRQQDPAALQAQQLNAPGPYNSQDYTGLSAEQFTSDPNYQNRRREILDAVENSAASKGVLRTGNTGLEMAKKAGEINSQEWAAEDARRRATNQQNNSNQLAGAQFNAGTNLAYNQNQNQNTLNFGQANIGNQFNANEANYGRGSTEAQQQFANQFGVNQANNQGQLAAAGANNQANLAYGGQNFQNQFAANQANNQGQFNATNQNFQNQMAAQGQQYGQGAQTYGLNLGAQNQGYNQAVGAYGLNAQTGLSYGAQNQQNQLANYQARTNAALGLGNLNLGYTSAANQYALGQRGLDLGFQNSNNQYALGQGQLGLGQGQLDWTRSSGTYDRNYQANVTDPWNQEYQRAQLGRPT